MLRLCFSILLSTFFVTTVWAQSAIVSTGGNSRGSTGNISFSAGQVDFITLTNTMNAGVQQVTDLIGVLPVKFLNITAVKKGMSVIVKWETASEQNSSHFTVYRSTNAQDFNTQVGQVTAAGFSEKITSYSLEDAAPAMGTNYYKVKQADKDNKYIFSAVAAVNFEPGLQAWCYPNPATSFIKLQLEAKRINDYSYQICDMSGKFLSSSRINSSITTIDVRKMKPGSYVLNIYTNASKVFSFIIVKK